MANEEMGKIRLICLDVDGTLTDGKIYYSESGDEVKAFNIKDGLLLSAIRDIGVNILVITGRKSKIVYKRMAELGIKEVYQGVSDKYAFLKDYVDERKISEKEICYIGDDLNDLFLIKNVGYSGCPADACTEVRSSAQYVSCKNGGDGAVRDILEHFFRKTNIWKRIIERFDEGFKWS